MNDCTYAPMEKDPSSSKYIPLYHHEQVPFQSFQVRPSQPTKPTMQQNQSPTAMTTMNNNDNSNNTNSCDLQDIILCYQSQPDLLRLILSSKLEEDKRRAEEAKLKAKELDLLLLQQQQMMTPALASPSTSSSSTIPTPSMTSGDHSNLAYSSFTFQSMHQPPAMDTSFTSISHPMSTSVTSPPSLSVSSPSQKRPTTTNQSLSSSSSFSASPPSPPTYGLKRNDINTFNIHDPSSDEMAQRSFQPQNCLPASSPSSFLPLAAESNGIKHHQTEEPRQQPPFMDDNTIPLSTYDSYSFSNNNSSNSNNHHHSNSYHPYQQQPNPHSQQRPRRRREMQAITKIVETRDYPYIDGHSWRNNGNTVQKKTGNKSVYYKCANSIKGCAVNKTLTWRGNGEYLIKYRGEHLPECSKMEHSQDI